MTGKEFYTELEETWNQVYNEPLDKWEELSETEQLVWEKMASRLRPNYALGGLA